MHSPWVGASRFSRDPRSTLISCAAGLGDRRYQMPLNMQHRDTVPSLSSSDAACAIVTESRHAQQVGTVECW